MLTIDRYLLQLFFKAFIFFFIAFAGLYVVIDAFGNLEEFVTFGEENGGLFSVMADYYGAQSLQLFDRLGGVLLLVAAVFTATMLEHRNEMTALQAAGIPKIRIIRPLIGAVIFVCLLAAINRELIIPQFREKLSRSTQNLNGQAQRPVNSCYDNATDINLNGKHVIIQGRRIKNPHFTLSSTYKDYGLKITAAEAIYREANGQHPEGYLLQGVEKPKRIDEIPSLTSENGKTVIYSPSDTSWLQPGECFIISYVPFARLAHGPMWRQHASTMELIRGLQARGANYEVNDRLAVHSRLVQPLLDLTLLFLGLPIILHRGQSNIFASVGQCILIVAVFFCVVLGAQALGGNSTFSPAFAAWCPLLILVPVAFWLSESLRDQ